MKIKRHDTVLMASILIAGAGLLSFLLYPMRFFGRTPFNTRRLSFWLSSLDFSFFNFHRPLLYHYIEVFFYILLLLGAVLYMLNAKEIRLIRFIFSIIFINNLMGLMVGVGSRILWMQGSHWRIRYDLIEMVPGFVINGGFIFISWYILDLLKKQKIISTETIGSGTSAVISPEESTIGARLLHHGLDNLICVLALSKISFLLIERVNYINKYIGLYPIFVVLVIFMRIFYYLLFEHLFHSTPAKFLTESRVCNEKGGEASFRQIFIRTLIRFVPFEPWSFIFRGDWHDKWSKTFVYKEKE